MAVKIRLKRMGKIRQPYYRVVVVDSRKKRDGRVIEEIGKYHPKEEPSLIEVDSERAGYWLGVGAQPTETVEAILKVTGDWQRHKGEPVPEGALKTKQAKADKQALYEEALKAAQNEPDVEAVTPKKAKAEEPKADESADEPKADEASEEPKADETAEATEGAEGDSSDESSES